MKYFARWERVLNGGLDGVIEVMTSHSEDAREMRQNSPFAGVLPEESRVNLLRSFNEHWQRDHERTLTR
ncbi:MAG: helix-turn-helix domain-containing protein, partial [Mycobacterium sp.]